MVQTDRPHCDALVDPGCCSCSAAGSESPSDSSNTASGSAVSDLRPCFGAVVLRTVFPSDKAWADSSGQASAASGPVAGTREAPTARIRAAVADLPDAVRFRWAVDRGIEAAAGICT